jgi:predicted metal-dependent peptidase
MDLVVNQYIERSQLPDEAIFLETFPDLNLEKDQTYFYYYEKLKQLQQACQCKKNPCSCNTGLCNSVSAQNLNSISDGSHGLERHEFWKEIYSQSTIEKEVLDAQMENLVRIARNKTSSKHYGTLPAGIQFQIDSMLIKDVPLVDWRRVLKLFAESSSKTKVKNTLKRPSKRYGTTPGIKIKHQQKLLIAIDTSGSISDEEYQDFFSELYHIWKRGTVVQVVECDTHIQHIYFYRGTSPKIIHGGGGTDFNDPIRYANDDFHPDALIYFTDGSACVPHITPKSPVLWVISKTGITPNDEIFKQLPGRKAKLQ